ncbi:MAG TPA: hypothetical protein DHW40_12395 [Microbacterium sp.]|nr:hypothetical protein [Microbacterium sp.]
MSLDLSRVTIRFTSEGLTLAIIALLWLRAVGTNIAYSLTIDKTFLGAGSELAASPLASVVSQGSFLVLAALCAVVLAFRINDVTRPGLWHLTIVLLPWLWAVVRDAYSGILQPDALLYVLIVVAIAALRPNPRVLALVGILTAVTAVIAIALGWFTPEAGLLREIDGQVRVRADKEILNGWGLLQGMFFSENTLGQYLALGSIGLVWLRPRLLAVALLGVITFAIVWSASRGALFALGAAIAVVVIVGVVKAWGRVDIAAGLARLALFGALAAIVVIPMVSWPDDAFSERGVIWRVSLIEWADRAAAFGLGSDWYARIADSEISPFHAGAVHGHNDVIQLLITGGLVAAVLWATWVVVAGLTLTTPRNPHLVGATALLVAMLVSGVLETATSSPNSSSLWGVIQIPLCILFFAPFPGPTVAAAPFPQPRTLRATS